MGFGDKLKGLKDQAQQAVAENKDKIQGAVQVVGEAANTKTHGKYAAKIMKVGEKVEAGVDKFADGSGQADAPAASAAEAPPATASGATTAAETPAATASRATTGAESPHPDFDIEGDAPQEEASDAPITHQPANPITPSAADAAKSGFPEFE